ncbi:hypothetical protein C8T65DRAFT_730806 [Cerioporus squamosus]|nr:hypothetical protein C8T65DRAFT_730806 [Cerioporus squamosus]
MRLSSPSLLLSSRFAILAEAWYDLQHLSSALEKPPKPSRSRVCPIDSHEALVPDTRHLCRRYSQLLPLRQLQLSSRSSDAVTGVYVEFLRLPPRFARRALAARPTSPQTGPVDGQDPYEPACARSAASHGVQPSHHGGDYRAHRSFA